MDSVNKKSLTQDLSASNCTVCGETFVKNGNYQFRVLPSKRIPKKAVSLRKTFSSSSSSIMDTSMWGLTKFQKYLLQRSVAKNYCEITCKSCNTICKFSLTKPTKGHQVPTSTPARSNTCLFTPSSGLTTVSKLNSDEGKRNKKKKKKKEVNAGLIIPPSFRSSSSGLSTNDSPKITSTKTTVSSADSNLQATPFSSKTMSGLNQNNINAPVNKTAPTAQNISAPLNQTAFRNLQKALFKSKNMDSSSSSSTSSLSKLLK